MIVAEQLTKRFGSFTAIEDVSFEVAAGEIVGFLGPNGAGKTTTMRILAGVFPPSEGHVRIANHDVVSDSLRARAVVGYFPERVSIYLDMTVEQYLLYVGEMKGLSRRAARHAAKEAMASCSLELVAGRRGLRGVARAAHQQDRHDEETPEGQESRARQPGPLMTLDLDQRWCCDGILLINPVGSGWSARARPRPGQPQHVFLLEAPEKFRRG